MHTLIKLFLKAEGNDLQITQVSEHVFLNLMAARHLKKKV